MGIAGEPVGLLGMGISFWMWGDSVRCKRSSEISWDIKEEVRKDDENAPAMLDIDCIFRVPGAGRGEEVRQALQSLCLVQYYLILPILLKLECTGQSCTPHSLPHSTG